MSHQFFFDLEASHKDVVFIYCTGPAAEEGSEGYNRFLRNEQIRNYCRANSKVLFDFESIGDCSTTWSSGSFAIWQGMSMNAYVEANQFYSNPEGRTELDKILTQNPSIKYTMFSWCGEMDWHSPEQVYECCHTLDSLDNHYQNVAFIHMRGTWLPAFTFTQSKPRNVQPLRK